MKLDRLFSDPDLAKLYDTFCAGRPDFGFYLPLVMSANAVLDVGCGTGELLRRARRRGHTGRLVGLDPAGAMLDVARDAGVDIQWVLGDLASVDWDEQFDLVVMTGHAFQVFTADDEIRTSLAAIRSALRSDGRFVFETRNPLVREWDHWTLEGPIERSGPAGSTVLYSRRVMTPVVGDLVRFTQTYESPHWDGPKISDSTLRFLDAGSLSAFLSAAGFHTEQQFGDWDRSRLRDDSPEIITVARPTEADARR
jgi:ubiquinone/menaquinone biosynthesis C-methylase UbiE